MGNLSGIETRELRDWLDYAERKETAQWLIAAIAYDNGVDVEELADWLGVPEDQVSTVIEDLESRGPTLAIAEWEGVDMDGLGDSWGLGRDTIAEWFAALDARPTEEAAEIIHRYSQRESVPLLSHPTARVNFLDYEVIEDRGWSVDDEDLFEKASNANLDSDDYGRFVVNPDETILEAAENRGYSWPYACRGGACANCAVIVKEGDIAMPGQTILTQEQVQVMNGRLTCVGVPVTEELKLVKNVQHLEDFEDLRLPSPLSDSEPAI